MLGWLRSKPTCPIGTEEKEWIENHFSWLIDEFDISRLRNGTLVLPTTEFFPASYQGTEEEIAELMHCVARHMDLDPSALTLNFYEENHPKFTGMYGDGSAGLDSVPNGPFGVWLDVAILEDPIAVVAALAHEIGGVILLGQRRISTEEEDQDYLADLLTVYLGMGIFPANAVVHENYWQVGYTSGWSIGRRGYITMEMFGYTFALYALARDETTPDWLSHLRPDVRDACKKGIRYVQETGDCDLVCLVAALVVSRQAD